MSFTLTPRLKRVGVVVAALAVVGAVAAVVAVTTDEPAPDVAPAIVDAFGADGMLETAGDAHAVFSPTGRRLLVVDGDGIAVAAQGRLRRLTPPRSNAVDAAWFPAESAVLIAEGPVPTGELPVVELDGSVRGSVVLQPSVGVGLGYGSDVRPDGQGAVVTAEQREPIGGRRRTHLVLVDLTTGATKPLTPVDGRDERGPVYLDETRVAYTDVDEEGRTSAAVIDLTTGRVATVSPEGEQAHVIGRIDDEAAYVSGDTVWVGSDPDNRRRVFRLGNREAVAVHPEGRAIVIRGSTGLRLVTVHQ